MITFEQTRLTGSVSQREHFFTQLYETAFASVANLVRQRNGTLNDAKDIFQDALIIFYEKIMNDNLETYISDEAYLLGIAKHLWIRKFNHDVKNIAFDSIEEAITIPDNYLPTIQEETVLKFLERAGKKCMELLTAFYYHKYSTQKIIREFGYATERSATVQKYKCMEKIRDVVKEKSINYEDFTD
jgi:DNA-directed RNA polymerase specialized sigma24 family protein